MLYFRLVFVALFFAVVNASPLPLDPLSTESGDIDHSIDPSPNAADTQHANSRSSSQDLDSRDGGFPFGQGGDSAENRYEGPQNNGQQNGNPLECGYVKGGLCYDISF